MVSLGEGSGLQLRLLKANIAMFKPLSHTRNVSEFDSEFDTFVDPRGFPKPIQNRQKIVPRIDIVFYIDS